MRTFTLRWRLNLARLSWIVAALTAYAALDELLQIPIPGRTADPDDAGAVAAFIRSTVEEEWPGAGASVRIQYGGSVKPGNIAGLMAKRDIDGGLVGQVLQFGFLSTTTLYQPSGVLYDNVEFGLAPIEVAFDVRPGSCPNPLNNRSQGVLPTAVRER